MKFACLLFAAVLAGAGPAIAGDINHQAHIGAALRDGCTVQHVHTPAGKLVHSAPIVRCHRATVVRTAAVTAAGGRGDVRLASASAPDRLDQGRRRPVRGGW